MNDSAVLLKAVGLAAGKHRDQRRKGVDASPYINHPIEVANLLANLGGVTDLSTLVAAILHDTIEDTDTKAKEIERLFGSRVRGLVEEVTDDKSLAKEERKRLQIEHAQHLSPSAKEIKLADKISNVGDVTRNPPKEWPQERREEYLDWAEQVVAGCRGVNALLDGEFDRVVEEGRKVLCEKGDATITARDLLHSFLELKSYAPEVAEWTEQRFAENLPRLYRLQRLSALFRAFHIDWNPAAFEKGEFIGLDDPRYARLAERIPPPSWPESMRHAVVERKEASQLSLRGCFRMLFQYRLNLDHGLSFPRRVMEAGGLYAAAYQRIKEANARIRENISDIEDILTACINPEGNSITLARLVGDYGYPVVDLDQIDIDWI